MLVKIGMESPVRIDAEVPLSTRTLGRAKIRPKPFCTAPYTEACRLICPCGTDCDFTVAPTVASEPPLEKSMPRSCAAVSESSTTETSSRTLGTGLSIISIRCFNGSTVAVGPLRMTAFSRLSTAMTSETLYATGTAVADDDVAMVAIPLSVPGLDCRPDEDCRPDASCARGSDGGEAPKSSATSLTSAYRSRIKVASSPTSAADPCSDPTPAAALRRSVKELFWRNACTRNAAVPVRR